MQMIVCVPEAIELNRKNLCNEFHDIQCHNVKHHRKCNRTYEKHHIWGFVGWKCIDNRANYICIPKFKVNRLIFVHLFYTGNHSSWYNRQHSISGRIFTHQTQKTLIQLLFSIFGYIWYGLFVVLFHRMVTHFSHRFI